MGQIKPNLVVTSGAKPAKLPLKLPTVIGRSDEAQLKVKQHQVSRKHCEIFEVDGELKIRDLGSSNGTIVNGKRIEGEFALSPGDELTLGGIKLCVVFKPIANRDSEKTTPMPERQQQVEQKSTKSKSTKASSKRQKSQPAAHQGKPARLEGVELGGSAVLSYEDLEQGSFIAIDITEELPDAVNSAIDLDIESPGTVDESRINLDLEDDAPMAAEDSQLHDFLKNLGDEN